MKSVRVVLAVVALLALPFGAVAAQSRGGSKPKPSTASVTAGECKDQQAATLGRATDAGRAAPYGLDKKCDAPPPPGGGGGGDQPPPGGYPTGIHEARGVVYEDVDGDGVQHIMWGELGLAGWTVQLYFDGLPVLTATTDADGMYLFSGLGDSNKLWWVCVVPQAGFTRTQPADGDPRAVCGGNGLFHSLNSPFMTRLETNFGEMMQ